VDIVKLPSRFYQSLAGPGREVQRRYGIPRARQVADILYYRWRLGTGRYSYYGFELFRPDLDEAARARFLSQPAWSVLFPIINPDGDRMDNSKLWQARRFADADVPMPRLLAYTALAPTDGHRAVPEFVPLADVPRVVPPNGCVLKRDRSRCGRDVMVFDGCEGGVLHRVDGERFDSARLAAALRSNERAGYLVQERLENHPDLAAIGMPSLSTVRVVTYGAPDDIRVCRATLKLPVGRSGVDNYAAGGIAAPIDLDSGRLGRGIGKFAMDWISCHPESGRMFEGMVVPLWREVLMQARRAAAAVPGIHTIGWDIGIAPEGVRILEGNSGWATNIVQRPHHCGIWDGEFRRWCLEMVGNREIPRAARRWLGIAS
jgi:hypothetical protein